MDKPLSLCLFFSKRFLQRFIQRKSERYTSDRISIITSRRRGLLGGKLYCYGNSPIDSNALLRGLNPWSLKYLRMSHPCNIQSYRRSHASGKTNVAPILSGHHEANPVMLWCIRCVHARLIFEKFHALFSVKS